MSGVIMEDGRQYEHCHGCTGEGTPDHSPRGKWVEINELEFENPSAEYPYGRDLCRDCYEALPKERQGTAESFLITLEQIRQHSER